MKAIRITTASILVMLIVALAYTQTGWACINQYAACDYPAPGGGQTCPGGETQTFVPIVTLNLYLCNSRTNRCGTGQPCNELVKYTGEGRIIYCDGVPTAACMTSIDTARQTNTNCAGQKCDPSVDWDPPEDPLPAPTDGMTDWHWADIEAWMPIDPWPI